MTHLPDISNLKINNAGAMALAKGDEMSEELKPCPFCGSNNLVLENLMDVVFCNDCGAEMSGDAPLGNWNTRPIEDALRAQLASRDALIERLVEVGNDIVEEAQVQEPDVQELRDNWRVLIAEWKASKESVE